MQRLHIPLIGQLPEAAPPGLELAVARPVRRRQSCCSRTPSCLLRSSHCSLPVYAYHMNLRAVITARPRARQLQRPRPVSLLTPTPASCPCSSSTQTGSGPVIAMAQTAPAAATVSEGPHLRSPPAASSISYTQHKAQYLQHTSGLQHPYSYTAKVIRPAS